MRIFSLIILIPIVLTSCSTVERNTNTFYDHPRDYTFNYETFYLHTKNDRPVHSWWLTPEESKANTIVLFFHDTTHNKSYFLNESSRLVDEGFNILTFDYLSQGYNDLTLDLDDNLVGTAAFNYLLSNKQLKATDIIVYAQGNAAEIAIKSLQDFGIKPVCVILENPPSQADFSFENSMTNILSFGGSEHDYKNNQNDTPVLIYCTEENEDSFDRLDDVSHLSVRAMLSGNGSRKILHSKQYRDEMIEFIEMSMALDKANQEGSPQE